MAEDTQQILSAEFWWEVIDFNDMWQLRVTHVLISWRIVVIIKMRLL